MKNLSDYILEGYDMLGHDVQVGDCIQFSSGGIQLYGEVTEIIEGDKEKYVVKALGWYGDKSLRNKIKETYKVNTTSKSVYKLNKIKKD
jgi:hypothetical protein